MRHTKHTDYLCVDLASKHELLRQLEEQGWKWRQGQKATEYGWKDAQQLFIHLHESDITCDLPRYASPSAVTFNWREHGVARNRPKKRTSSAKNQRTVMA